MVTAEKIHKFNWTSTSNIIAIILIIIGSITIILTFANNAQCNTSPVLSPNHVNFLVFGFGMAALMVGIIILYQGDGK